MHEDEKRLAARQQAAEDADALARFVGRVAHDARSVYFEYLGEEDQALEELRRGCEAPDVSDWVLLRYAAGLFGRGAFEDALHVLDRAPASGQFVA